MRAATIPPVIELRQLALVALLAAVVPAQGPRNIVLIVSDDHRHDFIGCAEGCPPFLETPNLDRMAAEGMRFVNAFVSTSLCSPSRASILTGRYMHGHRVADNQNPVPEGTRFFPEFLRQAGFATAFVGKWHMGHDDDLPRPGYEHWVSFRGQGTYFDPLLNVNGEHEQTSGYTADVLTDRALAWLRERGDDRPFFLHLAYKAVHYPFTPAPRHRGRYAAAEVPYSETMADTEENYRSQSAWIRERRQGIHGVEHMITGRFDGDPVPDFEALFRSYCETVHGLDEDIGRVLDYLRASGLAASTLVVYTSDNGFALGEHGFYDKRDAFEESIRVPLLAWAPGWIEPGSRAAQLVQNIDLAPTLLDVAGTGFPAEVPVDGRSFRPLLAGREVPWRDHVLYEYFWEWNFPATPTTFAIRTERFKYVHYHGIWDDDGFYDLATDPHERCNLIRVPLYRDQIDALREQLFDELGASGPLSIPVLPPRGERLDDRRLRR
ncbi:MAG: sulfatase [Planctomycetes bacterium]|nr:sulfatase [Planctomycetota bacterium]